ncbi:hypothetical protein EDEG_01802 [Edhazardia aedis USNM 41457]|uniref:Uncharacterized protein n=1 Tax=Edhazardia aedis (strain USNM 41457) TaxID=1003232 RepID=J8ZW44_EDHAE|nr:hypothetical protein EDEG_01802 [Edhazardia aedis USNM 41457]|eukprot:EJW03908.1 hypothetical protein EDEG_01802 [Edhazardia aedis USNM 41457]
MSSSDEEMYLIEKEHILEEAKIQKLVDVNNRISIENAFYAKTKELVYNKRVFAIFFGFIDSLNIGDIIIERFLLCDKVIEAKMIFILENDIRDINRIKGILTSDSF